MAKLVTRYELSGAGAGQMRLELEGEYEHFDITRYDAGDNRANLLENENESYLLYWWHRLDQDGFVQYTLCILDKSQGAKVYAFALVSDQKNVGKQSTAANKIEDTRDTIALHMAAVGEEVTSLSSITIMREI